MKTAIKHPQSADPNHLAAARPEKLSVYMIECSSCGFEPDEQLFLRPARCPKCHRYAWRQLPRPGKLAVRPAGEDRTAMQ